MKARPKSIKAPILPSLYGAGQVNVESYDSYLRHLAQANLTSEERLLTVYAHEPVTFYGVEHVAPRLELANFLTRCGLSSEIIALAAATPIQRPIKWCEGCKWIHPGRHLAIWDLHEDCPTHASKLVSCCALCGRTPSSVRTWANLKQGCGCQFVW